MENQSNLTVSKYTPAVASKGRARIDDTATKAPNFFDPKRGSSTRRRYSERDVATRGPMLRRGERRGGGRVKERVSTHVKRRLEMHLYATQDSYMRMLESET